MSEFKDKNSLGKSYKTIGASSLSASLAAAADSKIDGRVHDFVDISRVPFKLKEGSQAKFVDLEKIHTSSLIRDTERGIVYVPFQKKDFQDMTIGVNSHISTSFNSQSYLDISASFAQKFGNVSSTQLITFLVEEFYTGSTAQDFTGPATASFNTFTPDGLTASFSGISSGTLHAPHSMDIETQGYDMVFSLSGSNFCSSAQFRSVGSGNDLLHQTFIESFPHRFVHTQATSHSIALTTSSLTAVGNIGLVSNTIVTSPAQGAFCFSSIDKNIKSGSDAHGSYRAFFMKGRVTGDADSGSSAISGYDFLEEQEFIIYSASVNVASGSFQYHPFATQSGGQFELIAQNLATASGDFRTLFYVSGANDGPSGSFTGSASDSQLGSPLHGDPLLRTNAAFGYYNIPGTTTVLEVTTSSIDNEKVALGNTKMKVPRFTRTVVT